MNEKFFTLPPEKQAAILNAGYRVFSQNSYKKSPMSEIAAEAGISKSLLFHYFRNKKELYLYLWDHCAQVTIQTMQEYNCYGGEDLFECMLRGVEAKVSIIRRCPHMAMFTIRAFYEKDPEICAAVQESYKKYFNFKADRTLMNLAPEQFMPGLDIQRMYQDMYWASEGYLWEVTQRGDVDMRAMEQDFYRMVEFWKSVYLRKPEREEE